MRMRPLSPLIASYEIVQLARSNPEIDIDKDNADVIAHAIMQWAQKHGVTHYSHWFQPLTGQTAQKQDACMLPSRSGESILSLESSGRKGCE